MTSTSSGQQIADGVLIFGAIQAPEGVGAPGVRMRSGRGIELSGQRSDHCVVGFLIGPGKSYRRHVADAQFADDFLPLLRMLLYRSRDNGVEQEIARFHLAVVASDAIVFYDCRDRTIGRGLRAGDTNDRLRQT